MRIKRDRVFHWTSSSSLILLPSDRLPLQTLCDHELLPFLSNVYLPQSVSVAQEAEHQSSLGLALGKTGPQCLLLLAVGMRRGGGKWWWLCWRVPEDVRCICVGRGGGNGHFCNSVPRKTGQGPLSSPRSNWRYEALPRFFLPLWLLWREPCPFFWVCSCVWVSLQVTIVSSVQEWVQVLWGPKFKHFGSHSLKNE